MRVVAQPAYVLHARPWRESSAIVELLTRDHGRVAVVARGLAGPRRQPLRAALQPLQSLRVDYLPRGELARLLQAEALDAAPMLSGEALLAVFYVNELMLRMAPRQDPAEALYDLYGRVRGDLAGAGPLAWTLRRYERDLLEALGFGLPWDCTASGEPLDPASSYRLEPESGPVREARRRDDGVPGAALLALAADQCPERELLGALRPALRGVLAAHLGATPLKSWGLVAGLARTRSPGPRA